MNCTSLHVSSFYLDTSLLKSYVQLFESVNSCRIDAHNSYTCTGTALKRAHSSGIFKSASHKNDSHGYDSAAIILKTGGGKLLTG